MSDLKRSRNISARQLIDELQHQDSSVVCGKPRKQRLDRSMAEQQANHLSECDRETPALKLRKRTELLGITTVVCCDVEGEADSSLDKLRDLLRGPSNL